MTQMQNDTVSMNGW